jgi:hypothetical protein
MSSIQFQTDQQKRFTQSQSTNPSYDPEPEIVYGENVQQAQSPNSSVSQNNTNAVVNPHTKRELGGAAVAGGVLGLVVGGPIIAAVAAGGCALAVTTKGQGGKVVRAGGEAVACVGDRLKKINKKHRVVQKTGKGITKGCNWVAKKVKPKDAGSNASAPMH